MLGVNIIASGFLSILIIGVEYLVIWVGKSLFPNSLPWVFVLLEQAGLIEGLMVFLLSFMVGTVISLKRAKGLFKPKNSEISGK